jgi:hypothetical protein
MGEPYPDQQQLPRLNFANRDWYKGVTSTNDTYTSAVFLSAAIHVPAIAIAVPVYGNSLGSDVDININGGQTSPPKAGYWVGILNLTRIKEDLSSSLNLLNPNNKFLLVDRNGTRVFEISTWPKTNVSYSSSASLSDGQKNQSLMSFSHLQSVRNALDGQLGLTEEMIDGVNTTIYYYPVQIHPHAWALLLL